MSRFHSYLTSSTKLIASYKPGNPLSYHLKKYFAEHKKFGSKDRKAVSSLCYDYFRCAVFLNKHFSADQSILHALFLCQDKENDMLKELHPELNNRIHLSIPEKLSYLNLDSSNLFAYQEELSPEIDAVSYASSFFKQPSLFIRIRPHRKKVVVEALQKALIVFEEIGEDVIKCTNSAGLDKVLRINKDAVIQDLNSQRVFDFFKGMPLKAENEIHTVWDTCAASGGKSILLYDRLSGKIRLTVSDVRANILSNLTQRLQQSRVDIFKKFIQNLSLSSGLDKMEKFSIIISDVPCTGSGTWGRTPEQYFSFDKKNIPAFVKKQQSIVSHVIPHLQTEGLFFYITCSVFKAENEEMAKFIESNSALKLIRMNYLKGYECEADTMFVAVFQL